MEKILQRVAHRSNATRNSGDLEDEEPEVSDLQLQIESALGLRYGKMHEKNSIWYKRHESGEGR
jgi:hypothetical protein